MRENGCVAEILSLARLRVPFAESHGKVYGCHCFSFHSIQFTSMTFDIVYEQFLVFMLSKEKTTETRGEKGHV